MAGFWTGAAGRGTRRRAIRALGAPDICLVYPPARPNPMGMSLPLLSAALKRAGHRVEVLDAPGAGLDHRTLINRLRALRPRIVGISIFTTGVVSSARQLLRRCRAELSGALLVCGGVVPTVRPEDFVDDCDLVVAGEGELVLEQIVARYPDDQIYSLPGVVSRSAGGEIRRTRRQLIQDLDALPFPDWDCVPHDIDARALRLCATGEPAFPVLTSRGCPHDCVFCSNWIISQRRVRDRSPGRVVDELEHLIKRYGVRGFAFTDDNFGAVKKRVRAICDEIIGRGLRVRFGCNASADTLDQALVTKLKQAGCVEVFMGIESGDPEILKKARKRLDHEEVLRAIKLLNDAGIRSLTGYIIGYPWDTLESVMKTIRFAEQSGASGAVFQLCTPFRGSELRSIVEEIGGDISPDDDSYVSNRLSYTPPGLADHDLRAVRLYAESRFIAVRPASLMVTMRSMPLRRHVIPYLFFLAPDLLRIQIGERVLRLPPRLPRSSAMAALLERVLERRARSYLSSDRSGA